METSAFENLRAYFDREVAQKATAPLRDGVSLLIRIDETEEATLKKSEGKLILIKGTPSRPDMTVSITSAGIEELCRQKSDDIADTGIAIVKQMISPEPLFRIKVKVHIGGIQFLTHGYLGILPLGGKRLMQFLAEKGVSSLGKIKDIVASMRN